jgi:hypothetical protein
MRRRAGVALAAVLIAVASLALFKAHVPIEPAQAPKPSAQTGQSQEQRAKQQAPDPVPQVEISELATDELPLRSEGEYAAVEQAQEPSSPTQGRASAPPPATTPPAPLLYIHVRDEAQRARAQRMIKPLATRGIRVSGIKVVSFGPQTSDLRYFRAAERDEARKVGRVLRDIGVPAQQLKFVSGFEDRATHRQYELWLPPERRER